MICTNCGAKDQSLVHVAGLDVKSPYRGEVKFDKVKGDLEDGRKYCTVFLSKIHRRSLLSMLADPGKTDSKGAAEIYESEVAPHVQKLMDWGVEIVGHLTYPSFIELAVTDLSSPIAVFEFLTVVDTPDLLDKVKSAGLTDRVFAEGYVSTINDEKW